MASLSSAAEPTPTSQLVELLDNARIEELSSASEGEVAASDQQWELAEQEEGEEQEDDSDDSGSDDGSNMNPHSWMAAKVAYANLPHLFSHPSILKDDLVTATSEKHEKVLNACLDLLTNKDNAQEMTDLNSHNLPKLQRTKHIKFLRNVLGKYPPPFQAMDAARPWLLYWALAGLTSLGVDVKSYKERCMDTFRPLQNPDGGFGGGHGHLSHLAASYAAVLSLAMVGGLEMVDRRGMWKWLGSVKQADGSFTMAVGGEKDVRGAYCALTIHTLLHLPLDLPTTDCPARTTAGLTTFTSSLTAWLARCQTFEGGIGAAPDNEAHGAYAFCLLACLCLLDAPHRSIPSTINLPRFLSWLSSRQSAPEGAFAGRTNKLVDACYSHWAGGCWSLVEAAVVTPNSQRAKTRTRSLWNREGLVRYSLALSQTKKGGLRDKPGTRPDGYHTCYSLAGLSAAQNHYYYTETEQSYTQEVEREGKGKQAWVGDDLTAAFNWRAERATPEERKTWCFDQADTVEFVHPVFVIPFEAVEQTRLQFKDVVGF